MICNICAYHTTPFAKARVLRKYNVQYFQCENCRFIQTEEPYWLREAYSSPIADIDIGTVSRGMTFSKISKTLILAFFDTNAQFLDYGGGYGFFGRLMRDRGFDFHTFDKYCTNLFSKGFEADTEPHNQYELATAFKVFEHFVWPLADIGHMLRFSKNILFSTSLVPASNPTPREWWYYAPDHGQHVSFYTQKALSLVAQRFQLNLLSNGHSLHLLTEKKISPILFRTLLRREVAALIQIFLGGKLRKASLLEDDFFRISGMRIG